MKVSDVRTRWVQSVAGILAFKTDANGTVFALPTLQTEQTVNAPWYIPAIFVVGALLAVWRWVETALPLLIVATALDRYRFDFGGAGLRIEHFVFVGVALAWLGHRLPAWQRGDRRLYFSRSDLVLVAYLAVGLVSSVLFAPQLRESLKFLGLMLFGVVLYGFVRAMACSDDRFKRGVWMLVITGAAAAAFGIVAWAVYPFGIDLGVQVYTLGNFQTHSPFGTLFDSNTLGMYAMAAALIQVTLLLDSQFEKWRVWLGVGTVITLIAVALSLTRVAWIGLVFGLFLVLLFSPRQKWALAIGGGAVVLVVLALLVNSAMAGGSGALAEFSVARVLTSRSIFFRLDAYTRAWNDFLTSPLLGNGLNVFAQKYTSPAGTRDWISNFFLMALNDTGVVGLVLLAAWLGWLAYTTWHALKRAQGMRRTMLLGLSIAYLALFVTYQATTVFWLGFNWVYLGLIVAGQQSANEPLIANN